MDENKEAVVTPADEQPVKKAKSAKSKKNAEVEALKTELEQMKDTYQRILAEYANYKRRTEQEKELIGAFTKAELLKSLLPTVDNVERAMASDAQSDDYKAGVDMTMRGFLEALKSMGLEEIEAQDAPFDPELHNAVMREDAEDSDTETVTQVFQKGYRVGDRVIRPAMVKVAN